MLLVEVFNEKQSDKLLKTSLLGSSPIKVERYMSLNSCCGVVWWGDATGFPRSVCPRPTIFLSQRQENQSHYTTHSSHLNNPLYWPTSALDVREYLCEPMSQTLHGTLGAKISGILTSCRGLVLCAVIAVRVVMETSRVQVVVAAVILQQTRNALSLLMRKKYKTWK